MTEPDARGSDRLPAPIDRPRSFSDRTVEVLREMVLAGRLRPGDRLNEVELAGALGISRGPLREAIQRLCSEGLLTTIVNRGAYVRTFSAGQLSELYEVRIALEAHAAREVALSGGAEAIDSLGDLLDETERLMTAGRPYPRDLDFHRRLVTLTGNGLLLEATVGVHQQIDLARARSGHQPDRARHALTEHREILDHLRTRRGAAAATALTRHLRASLRNALLLFDTAGPAPARNGDHEPEPSRRAR